MPGVPVRSYTRIVRGKAVPVNSYKRGVARAPWRPIPGSGVNDSQAVKRIMFKIDPSRYGPVH